LEKKEPVRLEDKKSLNTNRSSFFFLQECEVIHFVATYGLFNFFEKLDFGFIPKVTAFDGIHPVLLQVVLSGLLRGKAQICNSIG